MSTVYKVFSVRDAKAGVFNKPMFMLSHGEAERSLRLAVSDPQSMVSKFPEDYDLYFIGEFDDESGKFMPCDTPQHVLKAIQVVPLSPFDPKGHDPAIRPNDLPRI